MSEGTFRRVEVHIETFDVSLKRPAMGQSSADRRSTIGAVGQSSNEKIPGVHSVNCGPSTVGQIFLKVELLSSLYFSFPRSCNITSFIF